MSLVDELLTKILGTSDNSIVEPGVEKTASADSLDNPLTLANELEKLAYSESSQKSSLSPEEHFLEYAAIHESLTGENILERLKR